MKIPTPRLSDSPAFSLIELLTVLAVIVILSALVVSASGQAKSRALRVACLSNLRQVGVGIHNEAAQTDGRLPWQTVPNYISQDVFEHWRTLGTSLGTPRIIHCPADNRFLPSASFAEATEADVSYTLECRIQADTPAALLATDQFLSVHAIDHENLNEASWETVISKAHGVRLGNGLLTDGSVHTYPETSLRHTLERTLQATHLVRLEYRLPGEDATAEPK